MMTRWWRVRDENARFTRTPAVTLAIMAGALLGGALLNAEPLAETASAQPAGWVRSVAVGAADALAEVSDAVGLDEPHEALDDLLGRGEIAPGDGTPPVGGVVFVPTAERPARLWIAGDSLVETIGAAIVNAAAATGVMEARFEVQFSSGITRPEIYDWSRQLAAGLATQPADILIFMVGANDGQAIETATGFVGFGTDEWVAEYARRVGDLMDMLGTRVSTVYWIGLPIAADERLAVRFAVMNDIYRSAAEERDSTRYIDVFTAFAGPDGGYAALLPDATGRLERVRDPDGVHFTPAGAELVAELVLGVIGEVWEIER